MNKIIIIAIVIGAIVLYWSAWKDEKRAEAVSIYEDCIMEQYNQTPADYYQLNGEYPICL